MFARRVGQRPQPGPGGGGKVGDHRGVDRVGLGAPAERAGEVAHLRRVDHHDRQPGRTECGRHHALVAARGLQRHKLRRERSQAFDQGIQPGRVAADRKRLARRMAGNVEAILGYVDTDAGGFHDDPSLRKRASLAAQATVRVHRNDGGGPSLSHWLGGPRALRPPLRHRTHQPIAAGSR